MSWEVRTMKSKTSFFNSVIFKKNVKHVWPFWGLLSFAAVIPSLVIIMEWIRNGFETEIDNPASITEMYYEASIYLAAPVAFALAIFAAMLVWGYLYNAKSVGAFHSFPITRTGLFITNYISGLAIMLIPYAIGGALFVLTMLIIGAGFDVAVFTLIGSVLMNSVFFFSLATIVAMMTGHILALPVLYFVFNFLSLAIENLFSFVVCSILFGFDYRGTSKTSVLSPLVHILSNCEVDRDYVYHSGESGYYRYREISNVKFENYGIIVMYAVAGLVLAALALLIYQKKKSETAGDVVSVKPLEPIIHGIYTITGTTLLGLLLYYIFSEADLERFSVILGIVCFTIALAISFYTGLMLLKKTVKVFDKKALRNFGIGALAVIVCCFGLKYDFLGLEKRVPNVKDISWVDVYTNGNTYNLPTFRSEELVEKTIEINKKIVDNKDMIVDRDRDFGNEYTYTYLNLRYYLKNGDSVYRHYQIPVPLDTKTGFDEEYMNFLSDKDLIKTLLHENDDYKISGGYQDFYFEDYMVAASLGFKETNIEFTEEEADLVFEALKKDLEEGNWTPGISYFPTEDSVTIGYLNVYFEKETRYQDFSRYYDSDSVNANLTKKMTNTLKALAKIRGVTYEQMLEAAEKIEKDNAYYQSDEIIYYD